MNLSNKQKAMLHWVPQRLGLSDAERRIIQRNVGGFYSAADRTCTREGCIAVMAHYEGCFPDGRIPGSAVGYWAEECAKASPVDTLVFRIRAEAAALGWTDVDVDMFLASKHCSSGRYQSIDEAPLYWLTRVLEALKAMHSRTIPQSEICNPQLNTGAGRRGALGACEGSPRRAVQKPAGPPRSL